MAVVSGPRTNHLLVAALPAPEWERWQPQLELADLTLGEVLYESGGVQSHVYFPTTAIVSLLYVMESGASAEIAVVGNEGVAIPIIILIALSCIEGTILMTTATHKTTTASAAPKAQEATAMLRADHKHVSGLFELYEAARSLAKKKDLVASICTELSVHAQVEEEIFYPAVKQALKDHELVPEASVEHATLTDLIAQVKGIEPDGEMFDAKIKVLSEYVNHHVKEEQDKMFPKARETSLDMVALGAKMATRKEELLASGTM